MEQKNGNETSLNLKGGCVNTLSFTIQSTTDIELSTWLVRDALFQVLGKDAWDNGVAILIGGLHITEQPKEVHDDEGQS